MKLLSAAGVWLGLDYVLIALLAGAFCGVAHGLILMTIEYRKTGSPPALSTLSIPAGPGFIIGILGTGFYAFRTVFGF